MQTWYILVEERKDGPYSKEDIEKYVAEGRFSPETMVWQKGMVKWKPAKEVFEIDSTIGNSTDQEHSETHFNNVVWYIKSSSRKIGPIKYAELKKRIATGEYKRNDLIYSSALGRWAPISAVEELRQSDSEHKAESKKWYLNYKGDSFGPYTETNLISLLKQGKVTPTTKIWNEAKRKWLCIQNTKFAQFIPESLKKRWEGLENWYYMRGTQKLGPFSTKAIMTSIKSGTIKPKDRIWSDQRNKWQQVAEIDTFFRLFEKIYKDTDAELWYTKDNDNISGPYSVYDLRQRIQSGSLTFNSLVFSKKSGKWERINSIKRLKAALFVASKIHNNNNSTSSPPRRSELNKNYDGDEDTR